MKKTGWLITLIILLIGLVFSQEVKNGQYGGLGGGDIGAQWLDVKELNTQLTAAGLPELKDVALANGGGGYGVMGRFLIGGEGYGISTNEKESGKTVQLDIGYGTFNIGYLIFSKQAFRIYALGGIGGGGIELKISQDPASSDFDSNLSTFNQNTFYTEFPIFKVGINADYILSFSDDEAAGGLAIGLAVGYTYAPVGLISDWQLSERTIGSVPNFGPTGPYITFRIGGGGLAF
ncbi:conserved hypothetical protein [Petrotoga mobilis SJ95]|jgi:opacity protein-like surface antigen|uniref:Outer membrane protein beta-barrel domain-containing protein n=1 Tax=Petrotoga mobilis (strain DSM 10674 / SJ95) TaxID=403833 RepID=A9BF97_PETMO|nr:hypothetical protein [Petrotoga mobilis]ABX30882.1 conserved hypothetical protein [Petrotoga mobilis SJ95]